MKKYASLTRWIIGFLLLDLYVNAIPKLIALDVVPWFAYAVGFFLLAYITAK